jgi:hypothetical protein
VLPCPLPFPHVPLWGRGILDLWEKEFASPGCFLVESSIIPPCLWCPIHLLLLEEFLFSPGINEPFWPIRLPCTGLFLQFWDLKPVCCHLTTFQSSLSGSFALFLGFIAAPGKEKWRNQSGYSVKFIEKTKTILSPLYLQYHLSYTSGNMCGTLSGLTIPGQSNRNIMWAICVPLNFLIGILKKLKRNWWSLF